MKNLEHIKGLKELPKVLNEEWIEHAIHKVDRSQMTPEQRMHFEMLLAKNASIVYMQKEEEKRLKAIREKELKQAVEIEVKQAVEHAVEKELKQAVEHAVEKELKQAKKKITINIAKKMKAANIEIAIIAETTGLAESEIVKL